MIHFGHGGLLLFLATSGRWEHSGAHNVTDYPFCRGNVGVMSDGVCHTQNNNEACGYDGGDCCSCTCEDGPDYSCGQRGVGFFCVDPGAPCVDPTISPTPSPTQGVTYPDCEGSLGFIGDGDCDDRNNNPECDYDGGDCCECTCVPGESFFCENFDCKDANASCYASSTSALGDTPSPTVSPTPVLVPGYPECTEDPDDVGDGYCDSAANVPECGYDGGDCCECTCKPSDVWSCGTDDDFQDFDCRDPDSGCVPTPSPTLSDFLDCKGFTPHIQDGYCDPSNNNEDCGYDGGDCCECTCVPGARYSCGQDDDYALFDCLDPDVVCPD